MIYPDSQYVRLSYEWWWQWLWFRERQHKSWCNLFTVVFGIAHRWFFNELTLCYPTSSSHLRTLFEADFWWTVWDSMRGNILGNFGTAPCQVETRFWHSSDPKFNENTNKSPKLQSIECILSRFSQKLLLFVMVEQIYMAIGRAIITPFYSHSRTQRSSFYFSSPHLILSKWKS